MAVIRISKTKGFTVMSNYHLRDKNLSLKAKGLLSMMLSLPDGWHYSVRGLASICKEGVSSISATIRELDACGYICRHQPIVDGKFQEIEYIIYETPQSKPLHENGENAEQDDITSGELADPEQDSQPVCAESVYSANPYTENPHTEYPHTDNAGTETQHAYNNKRTKSNKEKSNTEWIKHPSINQRAAADDEMDAMGTTPMDFVKMLEATRLTGNFERYREIVKENIEFDCLCRQHDRETLEGIVEIMVETLCSQTPYTRIGGQDFPTEVVKSRLMKLDSQHIEYVLTALAQNTTRIHNMKAYLLTTLYNSYTTINPFYENWVNSDFPQYAPGK